LSIQGGCSKNFYGRESTGTPLQANGHSGVINYEPEELVLTARAGTTLVELETLLKEQGQMLAFEPPHYGDTATLGGTIACGFSGPRRPYSGAVRDFVLGTRIINGRGEVLRFGGEVMKNVAGYDVSRLMVGALGTLGLILDVSLKVLPRPEKDGTRMLECDPEKAIEIMNNWAGTHLPISAACYDGANLYVRLSGTQSAVSAGYKRVGGDKMKDSMAFWRSVREHSHGFFSKNEPLWRLSVAPDSPSLDLPGKQFTDWGGAQRWLISDAAAETIRNRVSRIGGHATLFRGGDHSGEVFQPLAGQISVLHKNLKQAFDPQGIFNPGKLYRDM
jgi:glycolate oxidase FAD binding subunit